MRTFFTSALLLASMFTFAQQSVSWIGGTAGQEQQWNEAKNWNTNKIPDENSYVIIDFTNSGHQSQPIIDGTAQAASITINNGGTLTIESTGELIIDGEFIYSEGISLYGGKLINKGTLHLSSIDCGIAEEFLADIQNIGTVFINHVRKLENGNPNIVFTVKSNSTY